VLVVGVRVVEIMTRVQNIDVGDPRVGDIYVADVRGAAVIPGTVRLTEAERKPTDTAAKAPTSPEAEAHAKMRAPDKTDKRRAIERARVNGAGAPTPRAADV
jgi:hypothetical protein